MNSDRTASAASASAPPASAPLFSSRTFLLILGALCVLRLVLNAFVPLMDPSEARYALVCRIMAESGNFLEPRLVHDGALTVYEGKPPLFFQAGGVACRVFGVNLFAVRLPSFLFAAGLLAVMYGVLRRIRGEAVAQLAVLLTVSSVVFSFLYAGQCMTDMALAFCVCSAVFAYMLFDHETARRNRKLASIGFFAALGLGMLVIRITRRLQILRERLITVLVLLHAVNAFDHSPGIRRLIDPQGELISVFGGHRQFFMVHSFSSLSPYIFLCILL